MPTSSSGPVTGHRGRDPEPELELRAHALARGATHVLARPRRQLRRQPRVQLFPVSDHDDGEPVLGVHRVQRRGASDHDAPCEERLPRPVAVEPVPSRREHELVLAIHPHQVRERNLRAEEVDARARAERREHITALGVAYREVRFAQDALPFRQDPAPFDERRLRPAHRPPRCVQVEADGDGAKLRVAYAPVVVLREPPLDHRRVENRTNRPLGVRGGDRAVAVIVANKKVALSGLG